MGDKTTGPMFDREELILLQRAVKTTGDIQANILAEALAKDAATSVVTRERNEMYAFRTLLQKVESLITR